MSLSIGDTTQSFIGFLRNIKIYSIHRSVGQARQSVWYYSPTISDQPYLIAYYPLTESIG